MQYYQPGQNRFVGDCMPFYHDGRFRLYYLLDENHHQALGGLGGHQWAQASTVDLVHWEHHPLAIGLTEPDEGSICTGSVLFHDGVYHAFYATRRRDRTQHLSLATSTDGIAFTKTSPNPFASPPTGYDPYHYRDPVVFREEGTPRFHLLATARLEGHLLSDRGGCLAHLVSTDLRHWEERPPMLIPGFGDTPECPDHFPWNGWYYLVFSNGGVARYRLSRDPLGPWTRPAVDTFDGLAARVLKTAPFGRDRRLGVAWLGTRVEDRDHGGYQFGGNAVFRELVQHEDGTLGTRFPAEMIPRGVSCASLAWAAATPGVCCDRASVVLRADEGVEAAVLKGVPHDFRLSARVLPGPGNGTFGLRLRSRDALDAGYDLRFSPVEGTVGLHTQELRLVSELHRPFGIELVAQGSILDLCVDGRRCLIDRCPERRGDRLWVYAWDAAVTLDRIELEAR